MNVLSVCFFLLLNARIVVDLALSVMPDMDRFPV